MCEQACKNVQVGDTRVEVWGEGQIGTKESRLINSEVKSLIGMRSP